MQGETCLQWHFAHLKYRGHLLGVWKGLFVYEYHPPPHTHPPLQPNRGCQRNKMLVAELSSYTHLLKGKECGMLHRFRVKRRQEGREMGM